MRSINEIELENQKLKERISLITKDYCELDKAFEDLELKYFELKFEYDKLKKEKK